MTMFPGPDYWQSKLLSGDHKIDEDERPWPVLLVTEVYRGCRWVLRRLRGTT